jgi:hypothetical protein
MTKTELKRDFFDFTKIIAYLGQRGKLLLEEDKFDELAWLCREASKEPQCPESFKIEDKKFFFALFQKNDKARTGPKSSKASSSAVAAPAKATPKAKVPTAKGKTSTAKKTDDKTSNKRRNVGTKDGKTKKGKTSRVEGSDGTSKTDSGLVGSSTVVPPKPRGRPAKKAKLAVEEKENEDDKASVGTLPLPTEDEFKEIEEKAAAQEAAEKPDDEIPASTVTDEEVRNTIVIV